MADTEKQTITSAGADVPRPASPINVTRMSTESAAAARKILEHSGDHDEAMKAFADGEVIEVDEATNRRLLRRIDLHMMPIMCVVYGLNVTAAGQASIVSSSAAIFETVLWIFGTSFLPKSHVDARRQYLDKTTLSYASIMGLREDIGLVGDNYQWLGSIFYFSYLAWEYPTNLLLQRLPLAKYSAFNIVTWGSILILHAAMSNFGGAVALRLFLGAFEAAVTPGFALFTSQWWKRSEQGFRTCIWFSFNGWGQIFGGLVAYAIDIGAKRHGSAIAPWKTVFMVNGFITLALGLAFYFIIPDNQLNAKWLSERDRVLAVARVRCNQQGIGNKHWKRYQVIEALTDPMTWAFVFYSLVADIPNGGMSNFFSQLIVSFGYTPSQSLLYGTPGGAMQVISLLVTGYFGSKYRQRILWSMGGLSFGIFGFILIIALPMEMKVGRLIGYYFTLCVTTPFVCLLSLISSNVAGYTKKTTVAAMYLIAYCIGNIIGPQTFRPADAPNYRPAQITILACYGACMCDLVFIWWYYRRMNRQKEALRASEGYVKVENQEWLDLTDRENGEYVYST